MRTQLFSTFFYLLLSFSSFSQITIKKVADLHKSMYETSGLALYKNEFLLTHNDGGNKSELFVLDLSGKLVKTINIKNTKNKDWEDLAQDDKGRIFIGDFGNNLNERESCQIYILDDGFMDKDEVEPDKITFTFEDQKKFPPKDADLNYDCEGFFWKNGHLYLFTKCRTKPFTGESRIYKLDAKKGKQEAKYMGSIYLCQRGWRFCSVTAVDYNQELNTLAILTYGKLYFLTNFEGTDFWNGDIHSFPLPGIKQREAVCFGKNKTLYITDEYKKGFGGGNLYKLKLK